MFEEQKRDSRVVKGVRERERREQQAIGSGAGFIVSLTRNLQSILRGGEEDGVIYGFKNISLATVCFAKLPLQTSMILAFRESPRSRITRPQCAKAFITYERFSSRK